MKRKFIDALVACGYKEGQTCLLQGTMNPETPYPAEFVTFWTNYADDAAHYENETYSYEWAFSVILYASDPAIVNTKPDLIRATLKQAGFIPQGKGHDIPSDRASHTGWAMDFIGLETT